MADANVTTALDELLDTLETLDTQVVQKDAGGSGDAIDAVLNGPARTTRVRSLREGPEVAAFRTALTDGMIRVDTANQLLRLVREVIVHLA